MFSFTVRGRIHKVYQPENDTEHAVVSLIPNPDPRAKLRKERNEKLSPLDIEVSASQLTGLPLNPIVVIEGHGFYAMHRALTRDGRSFIARDLHLAADRIKLDPVGPVAKAG